jgi:hypothetical protein
VAQVKESREAYGARTLPVPLDGVTTATRPTRFRVFVTRRSRRGFGTDGVMRTQVALPPRVSIKSPVCFARWRLLSIGCDT